MRSLIPHAAPYVAYVALGAAAGVCPWADGVRVAVVAAMLLLLTRNGSYPELSARPSAAHVALGVAAGVVVGFAWVPLANLVPMTSESARTALDPSASLLRTTFRLASMVLVAPLAEELFVRSLVPRFVESGCSDEWRSRPVGAFTWTSAAFSVALFAIGHPEWLAALVTGVLWTALLWKTRNLRVVIVSHVVANALLAGRVLVTGETRWW